MQKSMQNKHFRREKNFFCRNGGKKCIPLPSLFKTLAVLLVKKSNDQYSLILLLLTLLSLHPSTKRYKLYFCNSLFGLNSRDTLDLLITQLIIHSCYYYMIIATLIVDKRTLWRPERLMRSERRNLVASRFDLKPSGVAILWWLLIL